MSSDPRCYTLELKNTKDKLKLTNLSIDVVITGFLAKTAVTMTFFNDTDHDGVEGELIFPMAEGSVLSGYAIDINGQLVDGVVIEKEKARQVFETEARKEVSHKPTASIAEHVVGNVFKTRIFPIPKRAPRTIRVTTVEEVDSNNVFHLLLGFSSLIDEYTLSVQVDAYGPQAPKIWDGTESNPRTGRPMAVLEYSKKENNKRIEQDSRIRYRERFSSLSPVNPKGCIVYLPSQLKPVIVESNEDKSEFYFVVGEKLSNTKTSTSPSSIDFKTQRIGLLWDTSLSRMNQDKQNDFAVIKQLITSLCNSTRPANTKIKIDLIPFSDRTKDIQTLILTGNSATDQQTVISAIEKLNYDGGTNFSALKLSKGPSHEHTTETYAYYCMFTDGMHNMSTKASPQAMEAPIYIFSSSAESNTSLLKILARKSGGEFFKISSSSSSDIQKFVSQLGTPVFSFLGATSESAQIKEMYPSIPTRVDGVFRLAGKITLKPSGNNDEVEDTTRTLNDSNNFVTLQFGYGTQITHSVTYSLSTDGASYTSLIPRFWAQRKIDELTLFPEETENEKIILELGRRFSIVTPSTSIIVLEELEQYLKHEIEPPEALEEIRRKWLQVMQQRANEKKAKEEEKIVSVLSLWNRRTAWWNEDLASNEAQEKNHLHFLPYGEGIDLMERTLTSHWCDYEREKKQEEDKLKAELSKKSSEGLYESYDESLISSDGIGGGISGTDDDGDDESWNSESESTADSSDDEDSSVCSSSSEESIADAKKKIGLFLGRTGSAAAPGQDSAAGRGAVATRGRGGFAYFSRLNKPTSQKADLQTSIGTPNESMAGEDRKPRGDLRKKSKSKDREPEQPVVQPKRLLAETGRQAFQRADERDAEKEKFSGIFDLFGSISAPAPPAAPASRGFGSPPAPGGFGSSLAQAAPASRGFGSSLAQAAPASRGFGSSLAQAAPASRGFGSSLAQAAPPAAPAPSGFGSSLSQAAPASRGFGSSLSAAPPAASRTSFSAGPTPSVSAAPRGFGSSLAQAAPRASFSAAPPPPPPSFSPGLPPPPPPSFSAGPPPPPIAPSPIFDSPSLISLGGPPAPITSAASISTPTLTSTLSPLGGLIMDQRSSGSRERASISRDRAAPVAKSLSVNRSISPSAKPSAPAPSANSMLLQSISARRTVISDEEEADDDSGFGLWEEEEESKEKEVAESFSQSVSEDLLCLAEPESANDEADDDGAMGGMFDDFAEPEPIQSIQPISKGNVASSKSSLFNLIQAKEESWKKDTKEKELREKVEEQKMKKKKEKKVAIHGGVQFDMSSLTDLAKISTSKESRISKPMPAPKPQMQQQQQQQQPLQEWQLQLQQIQERWLPELQQPQQPQKPQQAQKQLQKILKQASRAVQALPSSYDYASLIDTAASDSLRRDLPRTKPIELCPPVSIEYAYMSDTTISSTPNYSIDLTEQPEFPPVDWDSIKYPDTPEGQSWKNWRTRHRENSWAEFEAKYFGLGDSFMGIFNQNRKLILESRIKADFEAVEAENRKNRPLKSTEKLHQKYHVKPKTITFSSEESYIRDYSLLSNANQVYARYLELRKRPELNKLTKFYMDTSDILFEQHKDAEKAATVLSSLAELELENPQFLRLLAFRLERAPIDPYLQVAVQVYRKILAIRPEEPQSHRDLAMALTRRAIQLIEQLKSGNLGRSQWVGGIANQTKAAHLQLSRPSYDRHTLQEELKVQNEIKSLLVESVKLLNDIVLKNWDIRFAQVEVVALMDLNRVIAYVKSQNLEHTIGLHHLVDPRVTSLQMPVDLRIQIQWDTDMTDVELAVIEPDGERCSSLNNKTRNGGMMSRDFTHGYGPVEYLAKSTVNGTYSASAKLFHALEMKSGTTILVRTWTDYGRPGLEKEYLFVGRLNKAKESLSVVDITVDNGVTIVKA